MASIYSMKEKFFWFFIIQRILHNPIHLIYPRLLRRTVRTDSPPSQNYSNTHSSNTIRSSLMWISLITMILYSELHYGNMTHYDLSNDSVGHSNGFIFFLLFSLLFLLFMRKGLYRFQWGTDIIQWCPMQKCYVVISRQLFRPNRPGKEWSGMNDEN